MPYSEDQDKELTAFLRKALFNADFYTKKYLKEPTSRSFGLASINTSILSGAVSVMEVVCPNILAPYNEKILEIFRSFVVENQ